jgi:hypothetical protein
MRKLQLIGASVVAAAGLLIGMPAYAVALQLDPGDTTCTTDENANGAAPGYMLGCFTPALTADDIAALGKNPQYLNNVGSSIQEGPFAASYETEYFNDPPDPQDATISWLEGTPFLDCIGLRCFLVVKDGAQEIASYAFEITGWNGTDDIVLTSFWPDTGTVWPGPAQLRLGASPDDGTLIDPTLRTMRSDAGGPVGRRCSGQPGEELVDGCDCLRLVEQRYVAAIGHLDAGQVGLLRLHALERRRRQDV